MLANVFAVILAPTRLPAKSCATFLMLKGKLQALADKLSAATTTRGNTVRCRRHPARLSNCRARHTHRNGKNHLPAMRMYDFGKPIRGTLGPMSASLLIVFAPVLAIAAHELDPVREEQQYRHKAGRLHKPNLTGIGPKIHRYERRVRHAARNTGEQRRHKIDIAERMDEQPDNDRVKRKARQQQYQRDDQPARVEQIRRRDAHGNKGSGNALGKYPNSLRHDGISEQYVRYADGEHATEHRRSGKADALRNTPARHTNQQC